MEFFSGFGCIYGYITGKEGIDPNILAVTSRIIYFDETNMTVTTLTGSVYVLGKPKWVLENEVKHIREFLNGKS